MITILFYVIKEGLHLPEPHHIVRVVHGPHLASPAQVRGENISADSGTLGYTILFDGMLYLI